MQKILGLSTYLNWFARFKISTLHLDSKEKDFFLFKDLIQPERGIILDIGANLGIMSYHLSKTFPAQEIHAFEPIPINFKVLEKVKSRYDLKNLHLYELAVGEKAGKVQMILPRQGKVWMQGLSYVRHKDLPNGDDGREFEVKMVALDELYQDRKIGAIKLDVENFEYFVLYGAQKILDRDRPLLYAELWENQNREQCFELLGNFGYRTCVVENGKLVAFDPSKHRQQNFIFEQETE